jgi:hypothetical protein
MKDLHVKYSKAQMKIQQMAFMLVTLMVFFSLVALIYFSISLSGLKKDVASLQDDEAKELARKMAGTPELGFTATSDCSSCIDYDKAKEIANEFKNPDLHDKYQNLWNIDYLEIECVSSQGSGCSSLIVIGDDDTDKSTKTTFITLARWDGSINNYRYDLGRIHTSNLLE